MSESTQTIGIKNKRLEFIEFILQYKGWITRPDLIQRFGISAPVATRELKSYRELAPSNLTFNDKLKRYDINTETFMDIFPITATKALARLRSKQVRDIMGWEDNLGSAIALPRLSIPNNDVLKAVIRGITNRQEVDIKYFSVDSGCSTRKIIPHSMFDSGLKWYVRAYDLKRQAFIDFSISRIESAQHHLNNLTHPDIKNKDQQWIRELTLELAPHPQLENPKTVEFELDMVNGSKTINVRAAIAGYLLQIWNVDCSKNHTLVGKEYQLCLKNHQSLYDVESAFLAPGYNN